MVNYESVHTESESKNLLVHDMQRLNLLATNLIGALVIVAPVFPPIFWFHRAFERVTARFTWIAAFLFMSKMQRWFFFFFLNQEIKVFRLHFWFCRSSRPPTQSVCIWRPGNATQQSTILHVKTLMFTSLSYINITNCTLPSAQWFGTKKIVPAAHNKICGLFFE